MFEKISDKIISTEKFLKRLLKHALYILLFLFLSVMVGAIGFILIEEHDIKDAVLHSTHILSGLGLVQMPESYVGRIFVAIFGLYSSLFFLAAFSVIAAPIVHRILHKLHLEQIHFMLGHNRMRRSSLHTRQVRTA
ncbi:hypothetical protein ACLBWS_16710 [Brucellaceae bacterium D45D]